MAIVFHCPHCGKKIEAVNNAGGKWGKCPACHNKVYVPPKPEQDDDLKLAPVNEAEEERIKQLMAETHRLTQDILEERDTPNSSAEYAPPLSSIGEKELTKNIILYLRQMADGELDDAQRTADLIAPHRRKAIEILDKIALSEIPEPELADVPQHVLAGFIRNLRGRIG
jgi:DNA-directed RNA polymerase subunit RPC12/RpoP